MALGLDSLVVLTVFHSFMFLLRSLEYSFDLVERLIHTLTVDTVNRSSVGNLVLVCLVNPLILKQLVHSRPVLRVQLHNLAIKVSVPVASRLYQVSTTMRSLVIAWGFYESVCTNPFSCRVRNASRTRLETHLASRGESPFFSAISPTWQS